eukprot:4547862-Amphidinium_carterae.1
MLSVLTLVIDSKLNAKKAPRGIKHQGFFATIGIAEKSLAVMEHGPQRNGDLISPVPFMIVATES